MNDKKAICTDEPLEALCKKQKKEIEDLTKKVEFYAKTIDEIPANIYWKDKQNRVIGFNKIVKRILEKFDIKDLDSINSINNLESFKTGFTQYDAVPFIDSKAHHIDSTVFKTKKPIRLEEKGADLEGNLAIYDSHRTPLFNSEGEIIGLVGISIDITERKKMEDLLRHEKEEAIKANLAKSRFLATVNHEIRTPLSCIISLAELLKDAALGPNATQLVSSLDDCAKHLLELINSVLDFNRLELEQAPAEKQAFAIKPLIETIFNMLHTAAINKHLNLSFELKPSVPEFILNDERFIKHVLINLINNSIKFTPKGSISLTIDYDTKHKHIIFIVKDTGIGIAEENLKKVFLPFQQIKDTYVRDTAREGTGLGLTIVKTIIDKLSGNISLKSKLGEGSTFYIEIPCEPVSKLPEKDASVEAFTIPPDLKILMIEDDPTLQLIHQKIFSNLNCSLTIAKNGTEGLILIDQYDVLLLDLSLPDISGFDVIEHIRSREDKIKNIPIIVLTAFSESTEKNRALDLGANLFLSKPLNTAEIPKIICSVLRKNI